ncbi:uncharacterized protein RBU47_010833 [Passerculus sandwichensis]
MASSSTRTSVTAVETPAALRSEECPFDREGGRRRSAASRDSWLCQVQRFFQQIHHVTRGICPVSRMMFEIKASGATPNEGHSLGIRMELEPEGARHTQERLTEKYGCRENKLERTKGAVSKVTYRHWNEIIIYCVKESLSKASARV